MKNATKTFVNTFFDSKKHASLLWRNDFEEWADQEIRRLESLRVPRKQIEKIIEDSRIKHSKIPGKLVSHGLSGNSGKSSLVDKDISRTGKHIKTHAKRLSALT